MIVKGANGMQKGCMPWKNTVSNMTAKGACIVKRDEINIRDPYVLAVDGKYYLYGTRSETCWGEADGFDVYVGETLDDFEGPFEIFHKPENFFATSNYWAPECYAYQGKYYLLTTFGAADRKKGIYLLEADSPMGPFRPYSDRLTPENWTCIDGTLYFENDEPYMIYSHSFEDVHEGEKADGDFVVQRLSRDLQKAVTKPVVLFSAKDCPWAKPVPFAKQEFGVDEDVYFSDGPCLMKLEDGRLYMIVSSWSVNGYAVGVVVSDDGVMGPWKQQDEPLFPENGGHGMFFRNDSGEMIFTLHYPNDFYKERPHFYQVKLDGMKLCLGNEL